VGGHTANAISCNSEPHTLAATIYTGVS
jgi:hypothetical protein